MQNSLITSKPVHAKYKGMSLLESLLVVVLLAIVMGLALPNFNRLLQNPVDATLRRFAGAIEDARFRSITNNKPIELIFYFTEQKITFSLQSSEPVPPAPIPDFSFQGVELHSIQNKSQFVTAGKYSTWIFPSGFIQPFRLNIQFNNERHSFLIKDALGNFEILDDVPFL